MKGKTEDVTMTGKRPKEARNVLYSHSAYLLCSPRVASCVAQIACPRVPSRSKYANIYPSHTRRKTAHLLDFPDSGMERMERIEGVEGLKIYGGPAGPVWPAEPAGPRGPAGGLDGWDTFLGSRVSLATWKVGASLLKLMRSAYFDDFLDAIFSLLG